jgi:putative flippase GtrA
MSLLRTCFGDGSIAATPLAVEIAILHNFVWHERFTWRNRASQNFRQTARRLWRFHAANGLVSLAGNTILMYALVQRLKAPALPTAMGAIAICSLANFLIADRWVYRNGSGFDGQPVYLEDLSIHQRRAAMPDQTASTSPKGHAP